MQERFPATKSNAVETKKGNNADAIINPKEMNQKNYDSNKENQSTGMIDYNLMRTAVDKPQFLQKYLV